MPLASKCKISGRIRQSTTDFRCSVVSLPRSVLQSPMGVRWVKVVYGSRSYYKYAHLGGQSPYRLGTTRLRMMNEDGLCDVPWLSSQYRRLWLSWSSFSASGCWRYSILFDRRHWRLVIVVLDCFHFSKQLFSLPKNLFSLPVVGWLVFGLFKKKVILWGSF